MAGSDAELKATMAPHINTGNRMSAVAAAVGAEGWVACDLCDKWRRIKEDEVAQYENKAFHCRRVPRLHDILSPCCDPWVSFAWQRLVWLARGLTP